MIADMSFFRGIVAIIALGIGGVASAQNAPLPPAPPPIVFAPGTGDSTVGLASIPIRPMLPCKGLGTIRTTIAAFFPSPTLPPAPASLQTTAKQTQPVHRIDQKLFGRALDSYAKHHCSYGQTSGPAIIIIVDFAKRSNKPRLYRIDLRDGRGIDEPILVAHGIGSDPNDDGIADAFGDVQDSLMSSLGPSRGSEIYVGINGRSLRLDGLEPSNISMRARDIVVHSYSPAMLRYFNGELLLSRGGKPGTSEGCFVVEPEKRDWIMQTLVDGGFLYADYSGDLPKPAAPVPGQNVIFARGTGAIPTAAPVVVPVSEIPAGTSGSRPTTPILPALATPQQ